MRTLLSKLLFKLGQLTYLTGSYSAYNYLMCKSEQLDTEGKVWGKPLARPEKDDV